MLPDQVFVSRVDNQVVKRFFQEHVKVRCVESIKGIIAGIVENKCFGFPVAPGAPDALPCGHHPIGKPRENDSTETADVDPEFERISGKHQTHRTVLEAGLNIVAFIRAETRSEHLDCFGVDM